MFEAVYISDTNKNLVYEYLINLSSPNFNSLINIINNRDNLIAINQDYSVYLYKTNTIIIYTLVSSNINPILPYTFIYRIIEVIHDYFGTPIAIPKIESNNDTLTLLINQMLDDGLPNITDFNQLRDMVPFKSFLSKILSKTNELTHATLNATKLAPPLVKTDIPWRRSNVKYTNNEMFVDIMETINIILKSTPKKLPAVKSYDSAFYSTNLTSPTKNLVPLTGNIQGKINFTSHLTGIPQLQLSLNNKLINGNFHRCIENTKSSVLTFIPPDGNFTLANYTIDLNALNKSSQLNMMGQVNIDYNYGLGINKNEFEIKLYLPLKAGVSKVENLVVEILTNDGNVTIKSHRLTHGDFQYKGDNKAEWNLRSVATGVNPILYGSIMPETLPDPDNAKVLKPHYIKLCYVNKGCVPSGLKVESLKMISSKGIADTVKPYKGVKYITQTGDFIIRS